MSPIADMVEQMLADGVGAATIVLAVRTAEQALRVTHASRDASRFVTVHSQTPGAIRARRSRANRKQNQSSAKANDVAETGAEVAHAQRDASRDGVTSAPTFLSSFSESQKELTEKEGRKKSKKDSSEEARARGQRMASGAMLTDDFRQASIDLGADPGRVPDMWSEFVDYWVGVPGQRGVKLDWLATWRNDVRRKLEKGNYNGRRQQTAGDLARELASEVRERERQKGLV